MAFVFAFAVQMGHTPQHCDAGTEPCKLFGVSPSLLKAIVCITASLLTGPNGLLLVSYALKPLALSTLAVDVRLRVERCSPELMNEGRSHHSPAFTLPVLEGYFHV